MNTKTIEELELENAALKEIISYLESFLRSNQQKAGEMIVAQINDDEKRSFLKIDKKVLAEIEKLLPNVLKGH